MGCDLACAAPGLANQSEAQPSRLLTKPQQRTASAEGDGPQAACMYRIL